MKRASAVVCMGLVIGALVLGTAGCDAVDDLLSKEKEARGTIEEIGDDYLVVDAVRYGVTNQTKYEGVDGLADLSVGDDVEIDYEEHGTTRTALEIDLKRAAGEDGFTVTYERTFDPSQFVDSVTNPYYPLRPGTAYRYEAETEEGLEETVTEVLSDTREVAGVTAVVVHDRLYIDDELIEDTYDWFAQDEEGNVWYLGEDTKEYEDGQVVSTAGSWEAGVDGARAGIIMPAHPAVGQAYYQEFYEGEAEDRARVLSVTEPVTVPYGSFTDCVQTEDTTPLEPDLLEHKYYCAGVGTVLEVEEEVRVELVDVEHDAN